MFIFDAHLDLAWNALNWRRDLTKSIAEIRDSERNMNDWRRGQNTVSLPELRGAGVAVCLRTVLARTASWAIRCSTILAVKPPRPWL